MIMKMKIFKIIAIILAMIFIKKLFFSETSVDSSQISNLLPNVKVEKFKKKNIENTYTGFGIIQSIDKVILKSDADGLVTKIHSHEGVSINKNDIIAELDSRDFLSKYNEAKSSFNSKKIEYESVIVLKKKGLSSNAKYSEILANYEKSKSLLQEAERQYKNRFIRAPFDGFLSKLSIKNGSLVSYHQEIGEITKKDIFKVKIPVSEKYINKIKIQNLATVIMNNNQKHEGTVSSINEVADENTKTFDIDVVLSKGIKVYDGQVVRVIIHLDNIEGYEVPTSCLSINDYGDVVIRFVENGVVSEESIEIIGQDNQKTYIFSDRLPSSLDLIVIGNNIVEKGNIVSTEISQEN